MGHARHGVRVVVRDQQRRRSRSDLLLRICRVIGAVEVLVDLVAAGQRVLVDTTAVLAPSNRCGAMSGARR